MSADNWKPIELPYVFEKAIACCVPDSNRIVVVSYEGVHDIRLGPPLTVTTDNSDPEGDKVFDIARNEIMVDGSPQPAMGLYGGGSSLTTTDGLQIDLRETADVVVVKNMAGTIVLKCDHRDYPPGWVVATFSDDGVMFVVATPDGICCWRRERV